MLDSDDAGEYAAQRFGERLLRKTQLAIVG
jgi:hypothetical protein